MGTQATDQTRFWRGEFGDKYTIRNSSKQIELGPRIELWETILGSLQDALPESILEVGANSGANLRALRHLSEAELFALEPNDLARKLLIDNGIAPTQNVLDGFATSIDLPNDAVELAFTSGVLIHVHPNNLEESCREIYRVASRYIVCI